MIHRLVFLYKKGYLPKQVDHIDRNPLNNKISNLRDASHSEQQWNRRALTRNKSGYKGVSFCSKTNNWCMEIMANGKRVRIRHIKTKEEAAIKYNFYAKKMHGKFAHLNKIEGLK